MPHSLHALHEALAPTFTSTAEPVLMLPAALLRPKGPFAHIGKAAVGRIIQLIQRACDDSYVDNLPTVLADGSARIGATDFRLPNIALERVIGSGANGVVFSGSHRFLDRPVAVKIWMTRRKGDTRDKFDQGMREARKAARGGAYRAAEIYDAGSCNGLFYVVMELLNGITLRRWLATHSPRLAARWQLAQHLTTAVATGTSDGIVHGDLHGNNIIVGASAEPRVTNGRQFAPNFTIVDFGTSMFSGHDVSLLRHWRVFIRTLNQLLAPFEIERLTESALPASLDTEDIEFWLTSFFEELPHLLRAGGVPFTTGLLTPERDYPPAVLAAVDAALRKTGRESSVLGGFKEWWI